MHGIPIIGNPYFRTYFYTASSSFANVEANPARYFHKYRKHEIFYSKQLFESFFLLLNEERLKGKISDDEYTHIIDRLNQRYDSMRIWMRRQGPHHRRNLLQEFRNEFYNDPLLNPHLMEAEARLKAQKVRK